MKISDIRRIKLKEWFSSRSIPSDEKSYISQLINGKGSFGEKAARRLETSYGMGDRYLDTPTNSEESNVSNSMLSLDIADEDDKTTGEIVYWDVRGSCGGGFLNGDQLPKGSHEIWGNNNVTVTVPSNCKSKFTANAIFKSAGIKQKL